MDKKTKYILKTCRWSIPMNVVIWIAVVILIKLGIPSPSSTWVLVIMCIISTALEAIGVKSVAKEYDDEQNKK